LLLAFRRALFGAFVISPLAIGLAVMIACSAAAPKRHATVRPRHIDFQDVLCTHQGDGLATCSCDEPDQVVDAKDPSRLLIRCTDGKRK
jgi:hypothetical protein